LKEPSQKIYSQSGGSRADEGVATDLRELFEERLSRPMHSLSIKSWERGIAVDHAEFHSR